MATSTLNITIRHRVPPAYILGTATFLAPVLLPLVGYNRYVQLVADLVLLNIRLDP